MRRAVIRGSERGLEFCINANFCNELVEVRERIRVAVDEIITLLNWSFEFTDYFANTPFVTTNRRELREIFSRSNIRFRFKA